MQFSKCFVAALVLFPSFPILAQQADAAAQQGSSATAAGASVNESAQVNAYGTTEMRPVSGELVDKIDSKSAKVGDSVVVKTTQVARTSGGAVIPKGSRIVGHVAEVRAHRKDSEDALLTVTFDRAELKGGQSMQIHSVIESIAPPVSAATMDSDDSLSGGVGGMRSSSGGGRAGGGLGGGALSGGGSLAGGVAGSTTRSLDTTGGATASGLASAGNGTLGAAGQASSRVTAATTGGLQAAGSGALAAHATGISGLMLAGDATGATSGTLSANTSYSLKNKNKN